MQGRARSGPVTFPGTGFEVDRGMGIDFAGDLPRTPEVSSFWPRWLLRCALAEFVGIAVAALVAVGLTRWLGEPTTVAGRLGFYGAALGAGALEGALVGWAQGSLLRVRLPSLRLGRFIGWTTLPVVACWAVGMFPSTFLFTDPGVLTQPVPERSTIVVSLWSGLGGALGGLLIGGAQALELRHQVGAVKAWLLATALGWGVALPLDMTGAMVPGPTTPPLLVIVSAALGGVLAGLAFAIPTGWVARRLVSAQKA